MYRAGRENASADALSRHPQEPAPLQGIAQDETQVAAVSSATDIATLLQEDLVPVREGQAEHYGAEQQKDRNLKEMIDFLQDSVLPDNFSRAKKLTAQESLFALVDGILTSAVEARRR